MALNHIAIKADQEKPINQSDIFADIHFSALERNTTAILLTPACDIAQDKAIFYTFAAVIKVNPIIEGFLKKNLEKPDFKLSELNTFDSKTSQQKPKKIIEEIVKNRHSRWHWIGKIPDLPDFYIADYEVLACIATDQLEDLKTKRLGSMPSPYRESIPVRYSQHMSRIGLPTESSEIKIMTDEVFEYLKGSKS